MAASTPATMGLLCILITVFGFVSSTDRRAIEGPPSPPQDFRDKRQSISSFFGLTGGRRGGPKWPVAPPPSWDGKLWDYGAYFNPQQRLYELEDVGAETVRDLPKTQPSETSLPWEYSLLKRSPSCMSKCVNQGQIHPIMCHSLC